MKNVRVDSSDAQRRQPRLGTLDDGGAASAQSFALLAVPSHAQTIAHAEAESADSKLDDKPSDPISEAGWLAAADALLMGGLFGEW